MTLKSSWEHLLCPFLLGYGPHNTFLKFHEEIRNFLFFHFFKACFEIGRMYGLWRGQNRDKMKKTILLCIFQWAKVTRNIYFIMGYCHLKWTITLPPALFRVCNIIPSFTVYHNDIRMNIILIIFIYAKEGIMLHTLKRAGGGVIVHF